MVRLATSGSPEFVRCFRLCGEAIEFRDRWFTRPHLDTAENLLVGDLLAGLDDSHERNVVFDDFLISLQDDTVLRSIEIKLKDDSVGGIHQCTVSCDDRTGMAPVRPVTHKNRVTHSCKEILFNRSIHRRDVEDDAS